MPVHLNVKFKAAVYHPRYSDLEYAHFVLTFETDNCLHATDPRRVHCYSERRRAVYAPHQSRCCNLHWLCYELP